MKQIIPFQKELLFKTNVCEITSISLEHTLSLKEDDLISGEFHLFGDYKMTEGSINREKFDFKLPFDIALDARYDIDSIVIDIDNFYYEVVNDESLRIHIDVYVDGRKKDDDVSDTIGDEDVFDDDADMTSCEVVDRKDNDLKEDEGVHEVVLKDVERPTVMIHEDDDIEESVQYQKANHYYLDDDEDKNHFKEFNIFENVDEADTYVTYHVYIVKDNDSIDTIMDKFGVSKEEILVYNDADDIKPGSKLIIPNHYEQRIKGII